MVVAGHTETGISWLINKITIISTLWYTQKKAAVSKYFLGVRKKKNA